MSTENLKELRNALSCWQDDYDCDDDKEQYDMFGAAIDAVSRLGFATIGGCDLTIFDLRGIDKIFDLLDRGGNDFIPAAEKLGLVAEQRLNFPQPVESTAG